MVCIIRYQYILFFDILFYFCLQKKDSLNVAVDIACGSGQGTLGLAPHFKRVIGYDISAAQINEGKRTNTASNVEYE